MAQKKIRDNSAKRKKTKDKKCRLLFYPSYSRYFGLYGEANGTHEKVEEKAVGSETQEHV